MNEHPIAEEPAGSTGQPKRRGRVFDAILLTLTGAWLALYLLDAAAAEDSALHNSPAALIAFLLIPPIVLGSFWQTWWCVQGRGSWLVLVAAVSALCIGLLPSWRADFERSRVMRAEPTLRAFALTLQTSAVGKNHDVNRFIGGLWIREAQVIGDDVLFVRSQNPDCEHGLVFSTLGPPPAPNWAVHVSTAELSPGYWRYMWCDE